MLKLHQLLLLIGSLSIFAVGIITTQEWLKRHYQRLLPKVRKFMSKQPQVRA
jgi:hypothetical protein